MDTSSEGTARNIAILFLFGLTACSSTNAVSFCSMSKEQVDSLRVNLVAPLELLGKERGREYKAEIWDGGKINKTDDQCWVSLYPVELSIDGEFFVVVDMNTMEVSEVRPWRL